MAIGRISGPMLFSNLDRQGVDLAFDSNLIYLDVANRRVGITNSSPQYTIDSPGNVKLANVTIQGSAFSSNTGVMYFGSNANVSITGGADGFLLSTDGAGNLVWANIAGLASNIASTLLGNSIQLGSNSSGYLVSNAVTLTTTTTVTNGLAQLNFVLGKLVPPSPPTFPGTSTITISSLSTYVMALAQGSQIDLTGNSRAVTAGTTVANVRRANSYTTSNVSTVGPGDAGTIYAFLNSTIVGTRAMTVGADNGIYGNLVIGNNIDYGVYTGQTQGFWESTNCYASGSSISPGWNEVYLTHSLGTPTNTRWWYFDNSAPGTPTFSSTSIAISSNTVSYSSTVPHLTSSAGFTLAFNIARLSGDMFPTSNNMVTGTAAGALGAPATITYSSAGVSWPLSANLYVSSGSVACTTTANVISGFGSSSSGPTLSCSNSYNTGTQNFPPGVTVLYKTGTASAMEETAVTFGSTVGTGSGQAARIINPGSTDNPAYTAGASLFNSQTSTLETYDATIVAAVLKHDQINYSTGYLPVGPNLSSSRSGSQYFTFRFVRTSVSKFNIRFTGTIAGLWVALPGSGIDTSSTLNGWLDMSVAYAGSGQPGAGTGGNGSNGCALGGVVTLNSAVTNHSKTCTFGTASSSSTATNEIYVRIKLTSGQTVTALSLETASN
jgi:hypothetical protein